VGRFSRIAVVVVAAAAAAAAEAGGFEPGPPRNRTKAGFKSEGWGWGSSRLGLGSSPVRELHLYVFMCL
jgi:hypothetical protein